MLTDFEKSKLNIVIAEIAKNANKIVLPNISNIGRSTFNTKLLISKLKVLCLQTTYIKLIRDFMSIIDDPELFDHIEPKPTIFAIKDCLAHMGREGAIRNLCIHIENFIKKIKDTDK